MSENTNQTNAADPQTETNLFTITDPDGREWLMRRVPEHFYLMYGQLPSTLSDRAMLALKQNDEQAFEAELVSTLTEKEIFDGMLFNREAVKYACVKPKISLTPQNDGEVSPFDISETAFKFLTRVAVGGERASGLESFRGKPATASGNLAAVPKLRKTPKRNTSRKRSGNRA